MAMCIVDHDAKYGRISVLDGFGDYRPTETDEDALFSGIYARIPDPLVWFPDTSQIGIESDDLCVARATFDGIDLDWDAIVSDAFGAIK